MDKNEIAQLVRQVIAEQALEFRRSTSSVEFNRSTTGKPSLSVKVYNDDPVKAMNTARYLERKARAEYYDEEYQEAVPILPPTDEELGEMSGSGLPAPAEVAAAASADVTDVEHEDVAPGADMKSEIKPDPDFD